MLTGEQLGRAVKEAIDKLGMKDVEVAKLFGVKPPSVQGWKKTGRINKSNLLKLIKLCESVVEPDHWGLSRNDYVTINQNQSEHYNIAEDFQPTIHKVPLIGWVKAGSAAETHDQYQPGYAEEWIKTTVTPKKHTYALKVTNDSMEPDFPEGIIIIVEPDLQPEPGNYVIAKNGDDEATFKQLIKDAGEWYLKPLNSTYQTKPLGDFQIIGVVREAIRRLR